MADENKPENKGPVVIRKGQVTPLPPEVTSDDAARTPAQEDRRPLWQRVADEKVGAARPSPAPGAPPNRGPPRPSAGPRRGGERDRPRRRDDEERPREPQGPPLPSGEPPPAPELELSEEGSFADLFAEQSAATPRKRFKVGDKVAGKIIQLGHDVAFLELGSGVAEGMIEVAELLDEAGEIHARVGDIVDGVVVRTGDRGVVVSKGRGRAKGDDAREALIAAAQNGLPVDGVVKAANKGGLEVEVHGQRAFCPMSQIDIRFVGDPTTFVGQKLQFRVQRADQRDIVLSRRALLEEEKAERARKTREALAPDAVFDGVVTSVQDYGAFVDIGGIEGLVHVSELSWDRGSKPQELLKSGDTVKVQVLRIDQDAKKGERISLSVRALIEKPAAPEAAPAAPGSEAKPPRPAPPPPPQVGDVVKASVDKIESFGIFVRFAGGRGLVPASETGTPRGADLKRTFKVGDEVTCAIVGIDELGRIRLSKTEAEHALEQRDARDYMAKAPRASGKGFGTLGDLLREKLKK